MSAQETASQPKRFTPEDIANLTLLSQLHFEKQQLTTQLQELKPGEASQEVLFAKKLELLGHLNDIGRFLCMFGENNAAPRILHKEMTP